jgi:hypothetical protein
MMTATQLPVILRERSDRGIAFTAENQKLENQKLDAEAQRKQSRRGVRVPDEWRRGGAETACFGNCRSGSIAQHPERQFPTKRSSGLVADPISGIV